MWTSSTHLTPPTVHISSLNSIIKSNSTCLRSSSAALLGGSPLAEPRPLARACCSLTCSRASARSLRSLRSGGGGGGGGGSGGAGASLPWVPVLGLGLSLVPALLWLLNTGGGGRETEECKWKVLLLWFLINTRREGCLQAPLSVWIRLVFSMKTMKRPWTSS